MYRIQRFALIAAIFGAGFVESRYSILALDSAKYKGYMTASFVDYMERYSYEAAVRDYCLPPRATQKLAMPELFDMLAGSETGAIIATSLVIPNSDANQLKSGQKNEHFARTTMDWFERNTDTLYHNSSKALGPLQVIAAILAVLLGWLAYYVADKSYEASDFDDAVDGLRLIVKEEKKIAKGMPFDRKDTDVRNEKTRAHIEKAGITLAPLRLILAELPAIKSANDKNNGTRNPATVSKLKEIEKKIDQKKADIEYTEGLKYPAGFFGFVCSYALLVCWAAPGLSFLLWGLREATVLENKLIVSAASGSDAFIPKDLNIKDIVSDDLLLTAWDLNNRSPRFFNQWSATHEKTPTFNHDLSLGDMTWASAVTPYYFQPATIGADVYISGDNVARSPALLAYMYANERKAVKGEDIRVVTVGSTDELPDVIDNDVSLVAWAQRLTTLMSPAKEHTEDYMLNAIMGKHGHNLHKYNIRTSRAWEEKFYSRWHRSKDLAERSAQMIMENKDEVDQLLNQMVAERIGPYHSCYTDFCGSEFPEFTATNPNHDEDLRFSNAVKDTYSTASTTYSPYDTPPKAQPAQTPTLVDEKLMGAPLQPAKVLPDGWDCTPGATEHGRTCKCIPQTAPAKCRHRFQGTAQATSDWCRLNPVG